MPDELVEENVIAPVVLAWKLDEARENRGTLHDGQVFERGPVLHHFQPHHQIERFVEQLREGMRRVNRQRRQHRTHLAAVKFLKPGQVGGFQLLDFKDADFVPGEGGFELVAPAGEFIRYHLAYPARDALKNFLRRQPVHGAFAVAALNLLFQARDAHFKKLVKI